MTFDLSNPPRLTSPSADTHPRAQQMVDLEQVLRVAELAQLELSSAERTELLRDLNAILAHVAQLNEVDTSDVPAMAQVGEVLAHDSGAVTKSVDANLRGDVLQSSLDRAAVMSQAPATDGTYFKVPKVIER
ncbi:MAG: Asp-tRNA(Asn)/Glu-tRNA(Gln) amidotransferase subunit GatC [Acidobacteriaceae bacterium]